MKSVAYLFGAVRPVEFNNIAAATTELNAFFKPVEEGSYSKYKHYSRYHIGNFSVLNEIVVGVSEYSS